MKYFIIAPTTQSTPSNPLHGLQVYIPSQVFVQLAPGIFSVTSIVAANISPLIKNSELVSRNAISIFFMGSLF